MIDMIPRLLISTCYGRTQHGVQMKSSTFQMNLLLLTTTIHNCIFKTIQAWFPSI